MPSQTKVIPFRRTKFPDTHNPKCPDKTRLRGYSQTDEKCGVCAGHDECVEDTLKRLMSINDDLNRKLGLSLDTDGWSYQGAAIEIEYLFDEWRQDMREALCDWSRESDPADFTTKVKTLHGATLRYLDKTWPEWREWSRNYVDNTHVTKDDDLGKLKWSLRMPYFVLDSFMNKMSASAWKVLCYIARRATFDPKSNHFGRCWLSYEEITQWTGVKQPERCIKELQDLKLLNVEHIRRRQNGQVRTTNEFTVIWFRKFKKLGVVGYE